MERAARVLRWLGWGSDCGVQYFPLSDATEMYVDTGYSYGVTLDRPVELRYNRDGQLIGVMVPGRHDIDFKGEAWRGVALRLEHLSR